MNQPNQNSSQITLDSRYRTLFTIWFAILCSVGLCFALTRFMTVPLRDENSMLIWIFFALGLSTVGLSFVLKRQLFARAITEQSPALVQTGLIIALAFSEVPSLLGLTLYFVTGVHNHYLLFMISALALLLHLPRRDDLSAASAQSKF